MNRTNIQIGLILLALFVFGCTGLQTTQQQAVEANASTEAAAPSAKASGEEKSESLAEDFTGRDVQQFLGRGIPAICELDSVGTETDAGTDAEPAPWHSKTTWYYDADGNVRADTNILNPQVERCGISTWIQKDGKTYSNCDMTTWPETDCIWIVSENAGEPMQSNLETLDILCEERGGEAGCAYGASAGGANIGGTVSMPSPPTVSSLLDFSCRRWNYDSSKFIISGKACTLEDLQQKLVSTAIAGNG